MFIGRLLATVVLPYMGIVVPINEMFVARVSNDHKKMTRWASFMICSLVRSRSCGNSVFLAIISGSINE